MKKKIVKITESQFEKVVKKLMTESARYVMSPDEFFREKNKGQQYHCAFENKCFLVHDGNHQIATNISFSVTNAIPVNTARSLTIFYVVNNVRVHQVITKFNGKISGTANTGYVPISLRQFDVLRFEMVFRSADNAEIFRTIIG